MFKYIFAATLVPLAGALIGIALNEKQDGYKLDPVDAALKGAKAGTLAVVAVTAGVVLGRGAPTVNVAVLPVTVFEVDKILPATT